MANRNLQSTSEYDVGDLLWSKIPGYPYWPCMVTYDQSVRIFKKSKAWGRGTGTVYHVQYFGGTAQHGWTRPNNTLDYRGEKQFNDYVAELSKNLEKLSSVARNKELSKFSVSKSKLLSWKSAIFEADKALLIPRSCRNGLHTYVHPDCSDEESKSTSVDELENTAKLSKGLQTVDCDQSIDNNNKKTFSCRETNNLSTKSTAKQASAASADENERSEKLEVVCYDRNDDINGEKTSSYRETDNLCIICERTEADLLCVGSCMRWFHAACLQLVSVPKQYKCTECLREKHSCFLCKSDIGETKKCRKTTCGKFYHATCIKKYQGSREKFVCPLHFCHTCFSENPQMIQNIKSKYTPCIRCPVAYHEKEDCLGAGSVQLTKLFVICPEHADIKKKGNIPNISWCSCCGRNKGKLLKCVTCPLAFHKECAMVTEDDNFHCKNCVSRKHFRNGMLVWVKIGGFKWWPAKILFQKEVPELLLQKPHDVGDFPVKTLGTNAFHWAHKGITREYYEIDKEISLHLAMVAKKTMLGTFGESYVQCLTESAKEFDNIAEARKAQLKERGKFIFVRTNKHVGGNKVVDAHLSFECDCDPNSEFPCNYDSLCLNRSMFYECHPSKCPAKHKCCNQKFVKREYPRLISFKTSDRGFGLKTLEDLKKGQFVIEYVGDVIDESELCKRLSEKSVAKDQEYYFLTLEKGRKYIDAGPRGNLSRYMNHSCSPNCETQKWFVNGEMRIGLFAIKDIPAGSEVTFNYNWDSLDYANMKCFCGNENCCGTIGGKMLNETDTISANHKEKLKNNCEIMSGAIKIKVENSESAIAAESIKLKNSESSLHVQSIKRKNFESPSSAKNMKLQKGERSPNAKNIKLKNRESLSLAENGYFGKCESSSSTENINFSNIESSSSANNVHFENSVDVCKLDGKKAGMKLPDSSCVINMRFYGC